MCQAQVRNRFPNTAFSPSVHFRCDLLKLQVESYFPTSKCRRRRPVSPLTPIHACEVVQSSGKEQKRAGAFRGEMNDAAATFFAGGLSGMTVDLVLYPLDTIKTRLQAKGGAVKASKGSFYSGA